MLTEELPDNVFTQLGGRSRDRNLGNENGKGKGKKTGGGGKRKTGGGSNFLPDDVVSAISKRNKSAVDKNYTDNLATAHAQVIKAEEDLDTKMTSFYNHCESKGESITDANKRIRAVKEKVKENRNNTSAYGFESDASDVEDFFTDSQEPLIKRILASHDRKKDADKLYASAKSKAGLL